MLGGLEILAISAILGGVLGIYFRNKTTTKPILGIVLGVLGALMTSYLLVEFVFASTLAVPVYSILGSWLFNFSWAKIKS